ncbi:hypothetical protein BTO06_00285 [Tenacibaculum sp. SZ-18]|uniref:hypothetical protein n=1 Tax=Tenacibaculum sp. SZ-18 TaxID=754423 RepID=UPI000C2D50D1|nr:hypothetical protein [Tenacibaculum sp. SZ-18]AUC13675.1 hypothetical protein BTO06_00285 [Tenacibaculum sp. SZ-18]
MKESKKNKKNKSDGICISQLSDKDLNTIAAIWSSRRSMPNIQYKNIMKRVKNGNIELFDLPFFICRDLHRLGYKIPEIQ